jgi:peptidyl-dipeptidase Dcp
LASKYREYILEKGGTEDPMELYRKFKGSNPNIGPLLEDRGLN